MHVHPSRSLVRTVHAAAAVIATLLPAGFLLASAGAELTKSPEVVSGVRHGILLAVPALAAAVGASVASGRSLAGRSRHRVVRRKLARMKFVAPNALLVLVPAAIALDRLAASNQFGAPFVLVQAIEFAAGGVNVALLALNVRDGLGLRPGRRPGVAPRAA